MIKVVVVGSDPWISRPATPLGSM